MVIMGAMIESGTNQNADPTFLTIDLPRDTEDFENNGFRSINKVLNC